MGIEVQQSKLVVAPAPTVWSLVASPKAWSTWWRECTSCRTLDGKAVREGSQLEIVIDPGTGAGTYVPVVDLFTDEKALSLTHRGSLVQATLVFYLSVKPGGRGTEVRVDLVMDGLGPFFGRFLGRATTARIAVDNGLKGLKRYAERMA